MISFDLSSEQTMAQDSARRLSETVIRDASSALSAFRDVGAAKPMSDTILGHVSDLGLVQSVAMSTDDGDAPAITSCLMLEQLAWGDANCALALAAPLGFVRAIADFGSPQQREEILPLFTGGYRAAAIATAEPGLTSAGLKSVRTEIVDEGDEIVLNGRKTLVPFGKRCSHFLVLARHSEGIKAVIVPSDTKGISIEEPRYTMGCSSSEMSDIILTDVRLLSSAILGGERGCDVQLLSNSSWIATSAILTGLATAAYQFVTQYTKDRKVGGEILATKQSVALKLVDMFTESEQMRWMGWRAALENRTSTDAIRLARLAHGRAIDSAGWIVDDALQFMGGHGLMSDYLMESWLRNTKTISTLETAIGV